MSRVLFSAWFSIQGIIQNTTWRWIIPWTFFNNTLNSEPDGAGRILNNTLNTEPDAAGRILNNTLNNEPDIAGRIVNNILNTEPYAESWIVNNEPWTRC